MALGDARQVDSGGERFGSWLEFRFAMWLRAGEDAAVAAKKKAARSGAKNIVAFVGSDEARLKEAALKRFGQLVPPEEADFGAEVLDGGAENAEAAVRVVSQTIGALQTLPFFGGKKVIWLKGATLFADSQTGKAGSVPRSTISS